MMKEPSLHFAMISLASDWISKSGYGGEVVIHTTQMPVWIRELTRIVKTETFLPSHLLMLDPGLEAMKATTTMIVLANTQEIATEKMMPKADCWRKQVTLLGFPRNRKEDRKQRRRERRRM